MGVCLVCSLLENYLQHLLQVTLGKAAPYPMGT